MKILFLVPASHVALGRLAALALITLLPLPGSSGSAFWPFIGAGARLIACGLLTDCRHDALAVLPFGVHLLPNLAAGIAIIVAPFVFGFEPFTSLCFFVMGGSALLRT